MAGLPATGEYKAIAVANRGEHGPAAPLFASSVKRALRGARAIRAATIIVNGSGEGDISTPAGGFKSSGFGGRGHGIHVHDRYTRNNTIRVDHAGDRGRSAA